MIILFLLDVMFYRFTSFQTYFIALTPVICKKEEVWVLLGIGMILDYFSFHIFPIETTILFLIFLIICFLKKRLFLPKWRNIICTIISFFLFLICNAVIYHKFFFFFQLKKLIFAIILQLSIAMLCDRKEVTHIKWIR